jgi:methylated-DNA-[protein]-cysteine S-methyltransferase
MKYFSKYNGKYCNLFIADKNGAICGIHFNNKKIPVDSNYKETPLTKAASKQLDEYFNGKRTVFDLPLNLDGTDFQVKVWHTLQTIPYGETCSYGHLAKMIGNPKACRAVGMANNRNPIPIIIPCHRVIGQDGSLTGYAGGLELKEKLLMLEKPDIKNGKLKS